MRPPSCGIAQQPAVAVDEVAAEPRPADDLGDERPAAGVRERLGVRPGVGARDDDGARPALEHERQVVGLGGLVRLADASAALVERAGCLFLGGLVDRGGVGIDVVDRA